MTMHTNQLIHEKSPYLLQHAHNPVQWLPWGQEAFDRAKAEDKPLFLSIGYSTCHWCHVMERECFEDQEAAELLNRYTVPVKIDREERPDLDGIYMTACQMMTGAGGWPLSIFVGHTGRPFFAATYIPKNSRFGRMGMMELLPNIHEAWTTRREDVENAASSVFDALRRQQSAASAVGTGPDLATLDTAFRQFAERFDNELGGFGQAPKFPSPHVPLFLLRYARRTGSAPALAMVEKTLTAMRLGGIFDHVGLGFHRYSTDAHWLLPHFEKMLYDQAMLALAYTEAAQALGNPLFEQTAREIFAYVLRDMTSPEGAFYSAEDADSEGEEGRFYVWTADEIDAALPPDEALLYRTLYTIEAGGNFLEEATGHKTQANIPHLAAPLEELAAALSPALEATHPQGLPPQALAARLESLRVQLFALREQRVHPHKDDKILTDWNGLMIAALAHAARVFDDPALAVAAARSADFLLARLRTPEGRLLHRYRDGQAAVPGYLDDYAFLSWGLIELYQATFDIVWLQAALDLTGQLLEHFSDADNGGFFFTADDAEQLLVRQKEFIDAALPSGNSVALLNLLKLSRLAARPDLAEHAARLALAPGQELERHPSGFAMLLCAVDFALGPASDVVLTAPGDEALAPMLAALRSRYLPSTLLLKRDCQDQLPAIASYTAGMVPVNGKATAYVCGQGRCEPATTDVAKMLELLGEK